MSLGYTGICRHNKEKNKEQEGPASVKEEVQRR
jgi:hypothetical protein